MSPGTDRLGTPRTLAAPIASHVPRSGDYTPSGGLATPSAHTLADDCGQTQGATPATPTRHASGDGPRTGAVTIPRKQPDERLDELLRAPRARWALAWLATPLDHPAGPVDAFDAVETPLRDTRLHHLYDDPAALLAEVVGRVERWRHDPHAHTEVQRLGPAEGYTTIARALLDAPAATWWYEPLRREAQSWICHDPGIRVGTGLPFVTNYAHHWDRTAPMETVSTSTRLPGLPAAELLTQRRPAGGHTVVEHGLSAWDVQVKPEARVYEIHGPADWTALVDRFVSHRTTLCQAPDLERQWRTGDIIWSVDWREMAQQYDGVHLSVAGWLTASSRVLPVPGRGNTVLEGWPMEGTLWFRLVSAPLQRLDAGPLRYGYGRGALGADTDLVLAARRAAQPWWRRWWPWPPRGRT